MTAIFERAFLLLLLLFLSILEHSNVDFRCCPYLFFFFFYFTGCWFFCFVFKFSNVREAVCEREWGQRHSCHIIASSISVTSEAKVSFLLQILLLLLLFARLVVVVVVVSGDRFRLLLNRKSVYKVERKPDVAFHAGSICLPFVVESSKTIGAQQIDSLATLCDPSPTIDWQVGMEIP